VNINTLGRLEIPNIIIVGSTLFLHGVCMLRECIYGECIHTAARKENPNLTHTITAYSVRVRCAHTHPVQLDKSRVEKEFTLK